MKDLTKKIGAILIYYAISLAGFGILYHGFDVGYNSDKIYIYALPMMIILCVYVFAVNKNKIFKKQDLKIKGPDAVLSLLPYTVVITVAATFIEAIIKSNFSADLIFIALLTFLIGIAEEGFFRKYLLTNIGSGALKKITITGFSVIAFAALHMMNMAGGLSLGDAISQSLEAVPFGIVAAILFLKTENLTALIFWHMIIDYVIFISAIGTFITGAVFGKFIDAIIIFSLLKIIYDWLKTKIRGKHLAKG